MPVDGQGIADVSRMAEVFRDDTRFATLMLANNETGAIQAGRRAGGPGSGHGVSRFIPTPCKPSAEFQSISTTWA